MNKFNESEKTGWLLKWTNYLKGWQKRYFVLSDGVLSYYKNESEVDVTCRGRIKLASAVIKPLQNSNFLINRGVHDSFHLRAENESDKQKWLNALNSAQREASKNEDDYAESTGTDSKSFEDELKDDLDTLFDKLQDIKACQEKLNRSGLILQKLLTDLDVLDKQNKQDNLTEQDQDNAVRTKLISDILKSFKEKNGSYKIALSSTTSSCNQFSLLAQQYFPKWCRKLQKEHETNKNYEQVINQLANHIKNFEEQIKENNQLSYSNEEDEKFYDAEEFANETHFGSSTAPGKAHRITHSCTTGDLSLNSLNNNNINNNNNSIKNSIKYEIKDNEPDQQTQQIKPNLADQLFNKSNEEQSSNNESSDREDELSLSSCNDDDNKLDEMIKSSIVLADNNNDKLMNDSFSRNSSSNNIVSRYSLEQQNHSQQSSDSELNSFSNSLNNNKKRTIVRRSRIPERPNHSLNLWSIMKNSIGRDLSKIPMPVNFNEPLSMLQRITEDFEYADLLTKASKIKDSCEQMTYVAAFCVSNYATTGIRTCKPFNPLLGETFECDRTDDLGWKSFAEQVSHHPPMAALHCEHINKNWIINSEFAISSKFRGKYLQVNPIDANHLEFPASNHHYTWHKVTTSVHNIIVGKIWIENHGDLIITNHTTGDRAHIKFYPYSYFSRDVLRKVSGVVLDKEGNVKYILKGSWDQKIEVSKVLKTKTEVKNGNQVLERTNLKPIWTRSELPPDSEKMYNLTKFAIELNEPHDGVAPTDSTLRPDQRLMEEGNWTEANRVKGLLEQKQREVRKQREEQAEQQGVELADHQPVWFTKSFNELVGNSMFQYNGDYWQKREKQDWSGCPDIYSLDEA